MELSQRGTGKREIVSSGDRDFNDVFQVEHYSSPDVVEDEFQATQGQIAWVARHGQDTSDHLAFVEHELKSL